MRCIALLSGGLDSQLAVRVIQQQGIDIAALHVQTPFSHTADQAARAAAALDVPLTVVTLDEPYLDIVRRPRFGYGRGASPCLDCRILMFHRARIALPQLDAQFVVSGEVLGQRSLGQRRRDLQAIAHHSGLRERLLRPLSALLLPETLPEQAGWVDRTRLHKFFGRGRAGLNGLAASMGLGDGPVPSTGCPLAELPFARKVFDLLQHDAYATRWDFQLLRYGRHFRADEHCKAIVGRRADENRDLARLHAEAATDETALLTPEGFAGPSVLVVGAITSRSIAFAGGLLCRFTKDPRISRGRVVLSWQGTVRELTPQPDPAAAVARSLTETP
ncbi:MAG: hypothetical protein MUF48_06380 [Pirellulaceae bacterium]|jgi:hypothetical protein|nr:hypothetical protein [Pirellulaceae bacterium]